MFDELYMLRSLMPKPARQQGRDAQVDSYALTNVQASALKPGEKLRNEKGDNWSR
jgi:hypothetical protein